MIALNLAYLDAIEAEDPAGPPKPRSAQAGRLPTIPTTGCCSGW
jgi:hypothetical protein